MVERRTPISIAEAVEKVMKHKLTGHVELIPHPGKPRPLFGSGYCSYK